MYLNTQTLEQVSERDIRAAFPNTSFADPFVPPDGYAWVFPTPQPEVTYLQIAIETAPTLVANRWEQTWTVQARFQDYTLEEGTVVTKAEQEAAATERVKTAIINRYDQMLLSYFDRTAQSMRYDNRITCALRAGYSGPFQAEGLAFAQWMDNCNALAYGMLASMSLSSEQALPTEEEFINLFPEIVWPEST